MVGLQDGVCSLAGKAKEGIRWQRKGQDGAPRQEAQQDGQVWLEPESWEAAGDLEAGEGANKIDNKGNSGQCQVEWCPQELALSLRFLQTCK